MKPLHILWLCAGIGALPGCVLWPHHVLTAPAIHGTVVQGGHPVANLHVQLADVMTDAGEVAPSARTLDATTDAQGRFAIGPIRRRVWQTRVPLFSVDQHTVPWGLRLSADGRHWQPGWLTDPALYGETPKTPLQAACDTGADSRSHAVAGDLALVGTGVCTLALPTP